MSDNPFHPLPRNCPQRFRSGYLARSLGVHITTVLRWVKNGRLPRPTQLSRRIAIHDREQVVAALRSPEKGGAE